MTGVASGRHQRPVPAIVFGSGVTALGVLRALRALDIPTYLVAPRRDVATRSRGVKPLIDGWTMHRSSDAVRTFLARTPLSRAVLIPCEDDWAVAVAQMMDEDGGSFAASMPPGSVVERLTDKRAFARTLEEFGIERPRTFDLRSVDDLALIPDEDLATFFLKPRDSQRFVQAFHEKAFALSDRVEATSRLERVLHAGHEVIAQERIAGPPQNHIFLDGFVDRHGRVLGLLARRRIRMFPPRFGNSTDTVTIPLSEVSDAVESLRTLFAGIGYRGVFDAEFKRAPGEELHKVIEVNARPWWQIELARAAGVDVVGMAYADALGADVEPVAGYRVGRRWVHTFPDLRARLTGRQGVSPPDLREGWFSARHAVLRWSDPGPGLAEVARVARIALDVGVRRR